MIQFKRKLIKKYFYNKLEIYIFLAAFGGYMENRIIAILPNESLTGRVLRVQKKLGVEFSVYHKQTTEAVKLAERKKAEGVKVVLSRGMTANYLKKNLDIPVIEIKYDFFHFATALNKALEISNEVAIIGFIDAYKLANKAVKYIEKQGQKIHVIILPDGTEIESKIKALHSKGINTFVGGGLVVSTAKKMGLNTVLMKADEMAIEEAIENAQYELSIHIELEEKYELIKSVIANNSNGIFAIDKSGELITANPKAMYLLGMEDANSCEWSNILKKDFVDSKIIRSLNDGIEINGELITVGNHDLVFSSSPITVEGEIRGVVVTVQDTSNIKEIDTKIRKYQMNKGHIAWKTFNDIVGESEIMKACKTKAFKCSKVDSTVLINGETGTGKEIFAQSIHNASKRSSKPFVAINCAALPPCLLESELFGYVKGAFSGANSEGKVGIFELAHTGTIFLDEISESSLDVQARLLRVIQEKEIIRIGDTKVIPVDVRIISATNKNLMDEVNHKRFRKDLFYRLSVLELQLPMLDDMKSDIPQLCNFLLKDINERMCHSKKVEISRDAIDILMNKKFDGNVRQLSNILERALVMSDSTQIDRDCIIEAIGRPKQKAPQSELIHQFNTINEMEEVMIYHVLTECNGNKTAAAQKLGISLSTLRRRLQQTSPL